MFLEIIMLVSVTGGGGEGEEGGKNREEKGGGGGGEGGGGGWGGGEEEEKAFEYVNEKWLAGCSTFTEGAGGCSGIFKQERSTHYRQKCLPVVEHLTQKSLVCSKHKQSLCQSNLKMLFIMYAHTQHVYLKVKCWSPACHGSTEKGGHTAPCISSKSCSVFTWFLEVSGLATTRFVSCTSRVVRGPDTRWSSCWLINFFVSSDHKSQSKYEYYDVSGINL